MRVLCFGASLTAQIGLGGYVGQLAKLGFNVQTAGFGGYQLEHAHLVVKDISFTNIDSIIVEWFSPVKIYNDSEIELYLGTLLIKLSIFTKKILCVLIPNFSGSHKHYFSRLTNFLSKYKVDYVNLENCKLIKEDLKEDGLHTLENGASKYAATIAQKINSIGNIVELPPPSKEFMNVKELDAVFKAEIGEQIIINSSSQAHVLGIALTVGPNSGIILMNDIKLNLWDKWSGRERTTIKYNFFTPCVLKPTNVDFDRSSSALQPTWGPINIEIKKIYYIGNDILVTVEENKNFKEIKKNNYQ